CRGRRGSGHGETGGPVSGHHPPGARHGARAARGLSGLRGVQPHQGGRRARLDRGARGGARDPHRHPPRGGRPYHQLLCTRGGALVERVSGAAPSAFLAACRRQTPTHRPIWIMRQAGRYLPEYRALRAKVDFATLTRTAELAAEVTPQPRPAELAAEVTLQPLRRFELDAAILFSDIMTPLQGMGVDLKFEPGPV